MLKRSLLVVGHFLLVSLVLLAMAVVIAILNHASLSYGNSELAYTVAGEGPHVFYTPEGVQSNYIRGNREAGFRVERSVFRADESIPATVYFALDDSQFSFEISPLIETPPTTYQDGEPIVALSDLEGNYKAFRDLLIVHGVIDESLQWRFGKGHLVLVGDMIDRGESVTQLLWLIYKLEQEAKTAGGTVHYILGNHEIKNLQGNDRSAANKYIPIAGFLGRSRAGLFDRSSFLGRWLASKNTVEMINGHLFVHGGLHPEVLEYQLGLEEINQMVRGQYRQMYYPGLATGALDFLTATSTGPAWYRGYFKDEVTSADVLTILKTFEATSIIVGHTLQSDVTRYFDGALFAIDVKHPDDYNRSFPPKHSEGLLIENGETFRLDDAGSAVGV